MKTILILGNPNSGKSLLFNQLTGLNHKVSNFPGVTVEVTSGQSGSLCLMDFPGIYSLQPMTQDEVIAVQKFQEVLEQPETEAVLYVADGTRLERSLYLLLQLLEETRQKGRSLFVAINMMDEILHRGVAVDAQGLSKELGIPVFPVSARTKDGLTELRKALEATSSTTPRLNPPPSPSTPHPKTGIIELRTESRRLARAYGPRGDVLLRSQNRLDSFFLSSFWGPLAFVLIMLLLFQSIFSGAAPLMDFLGATISASGAWVASHLAEGLAADFIKDALFEGLGSFLVFVPQIFVLFVIIGILEDSGYLARATVLLHRPLSWVGLSGRSFVPLLSGHACAIPALLATRTIESPRRRLLTMLAIPFISCSARLPIYALLISAFIPARALLGPLLTLQGLTFFGLYALGLSTGLIAARILSWATPRSAKEDPPFVVELPPYRWPSLGPILKNSLHRAWIFTREAGPIIFGVSVVVWVLGYFPHGPGHLNESWLAVVGRWTEPLVAPMGLDWKMGVAILTSFLAREVFVGTLGTLHGIENATDDIPTLSHTLTASGMTLATGMALLVFYCLAMQCVSTLAVMKQETGKRWLPFAVFGGMTLIAYSAALLAFHLFQL